MTCFVSTRLELQSWCSVTFFAIDTRYELIVGGHIYAVQPVQAGPAERSTLYWPAFSHANIADFDLKIRVDLP